MTKMIKMSLIAAVAVTSMTSVASAQNLEDAIKGVDFSGNLRYRYTNGEANTVDTNEYRLEVTVKSKVNDMTTATVSTNTKTNGGSSTAATTSDTTTKGDADPVAANITEASFTFALPGATVIAGKQALATPFASGQAEDQQGTGVVALVPVAGVTVAAGLYLNSDAQSKNNGITDLDLGANNIAAVAVLGAAGSVKYAAWYASVSETDLTANNVAAAANISAGAKAMNLNVSAPVGPVNVEVNYAKVDYTASGTGTAGTIAAINKYDPTQSRIVVSGKVDTVSLAAGYVKAGEYGGDVTLGDDDSSANFGTMEKFTAVSLKDTSAFYLAAKAPVGPVTVGLEHGTTSDVDGKTAGDVKFSETKLSVAYAMSKNFTISGWMTSTAGDKSGATDYSKLGQNRIEVLYKF